MLRRPPATATSLAILLPAALTACVAENDRLTLGHEVNLSALSPDRPSILDNQPPPQFATSTKAFPDGERSITGIDRANWETKEFLVPVDGTGHRPTYAVSVQLKNSTARQRGEYPTAYTALERDGGFTDEQLVEVVTSPLVVFGGALLIPFRLIAEPQCLTEYSPAWNYDRWRTGRDPLVPLPPPPLPIEGTLPAPPVPTSTNPGPAPDPNAPPTPTDTEPTPDTAPADTTPTDPQPI